MFVNWENVDLDSEDKLHSSDHIRTQQSATNIHEENERKRLCQLKKLKCHQVCDDKRRDFTTSMTKFGQLLTDNRITEISNTLLTENCESFLFNVAQMYSALFALKREEFAGLFQGYQIIQREVKETYVHLEKAICFQLCYCIIQNKKDSSTIWQFSFEAFSFTDNKISKYRASFASMPSLADAQSLFSPSRKEKMLGKVKQINYAFADQPNLERIALLMDSNTEYKIWRWKDKKCSTFNKQNLAAEFRKSLEEDYIIKSIVPFDPTIEAQFIVGSYVYYLEGKGKLSGKKFHWISNCLFAFDQDANLAKISQQGELYDEDQILIPFEIYTEEKIQHMIDSIHQISKAKGFSILVHEEVNFSFDFGIFSQSDVPAAGLIKGLNEYKKLTDLIASSEGDPDQTKTVDIYLGCDDPCYDTAIIIDYTQEVLHKEGDPHDGKPIGLFGIKKYSFENGKLAKAVFFITGFREIIPSPYDENDFADINVRPKHEFLSK